MPPRHHLAALITATVILGAVPALAADPVPAKPVCAPAVSMALTAWDTSMAAAEKFGEKAANLAREKGREYLLPLLGVENGSKTADPDAEEATGNVGREVEASRKDPARREALCVAVTQAANDAKAKVGSGIDALKGALERFRPAQPASPQPVPDGANKGGLIKT